MSERTPEQIARDAQARHSQRFRKRHLLRSPGDSALGSLGNSENAEDTADPGHIEDNVLAPTLVQHRPDVTATPPAYLSPERKNRQQPRIAAGGVARHQSPLKSLKNDDDSDADTAEQGLGEIDAGLDTEPPRPRGWLLGNVFCRNFLGSLLADGGVGKTALRYLQMLALATGRALTGEHVFQRCRVLIISLEDDLEELKRRILAAMIYHNISYDELAGWLFYCSPGRAGGKLMTLDARGRAVEGKLTGKIENVVKARKIDMVMLDPFVKSHSVEENHNTLIDEVAQLLTDMASKYNIAADAPHHTSKGAAEPGNADRGRGASAMKDAARLVYTLTVMSTDEAKAFGIKDEDKWQYLRVDSGKVNITKHLRAAKWFRLVGVPLDNATEIYPNGDDVQTVEPWKPPETWADLSSDLLNKILTTIDGGLPDGNRYTHAPRTTDRSAWKVVIANAPHKSETQAREVITTWIKNGVLMLKEYENPQTRKTVNGLHVDNTKRPS